jgi:hypothetical protein
MIVFIKNKVIVCENNGCVFPFLHFYLQKDNS